MATTLLIGGVRSGKSAWAVNYAKPFKKKLFIATAEPCDEEMEARIRKHQEERGEEWECIEAGEKIIDALAKHGNQYDCIVIDCITVWTALIMNEEKEHDEIVKKWVTPLVKYIKTLKADIVIVTNEVGMGVHPEYESGRRYRDLLGMINQKFARVCGNVLFFVAGIPMAVKGTIPE